MRCFVAIDLAEELKSEIVKIQENIADSKMSLVNPDNLHVTLKFLGELSEQDVNKVCHILEEIKHKEFEISIQGLGVFPSHTSKDSYKSSGIVKDKILYNKNPRVAWVGVVGKELKELAEAIENSLIEAGFVKEEREFNGHLTIARIKGVSRNLYKKTSDLNAVKIGSQKVKGFSLKKSTLLPSGPVYEDIKKFVLE